MVERISKIEKPADIICAHRGYKKPENTLMAFNNAIKAGASWIEFDVHLTKDGEFIVWHDMTLKKLGLKKRPEIMNTAELKKLDLGNGQVMPTLAEVIKAFDGEINLNIELKTASAGEELGNYLSSFTPKSSWVISSFFHDALKLLDKKFDYNLGVLYVFPIKNYLKTALEINAYSINPFHYFASKKKIKKAHENGIRVIPWTIDKEKSIIKIIERGADLIITNETEKALKIAEKILQK